MDARLEMVAVSHFLGIFVVIQEEISSTAEIGLGEVGG